MMSLFSSFDIMFFNFFYLIYLFLVGVIFSIFGLSHYINFLLKFFFSEMIKFLESLKPKMFLVSCFLMLMSLMIMIAFFNFFSIFSYNFPLSSQVSVVVSISMIYWISIVSLSVTKNLKGFMAHLIPEGTPIFLTWFLFLIELTSNIIRPITLSVRLISNILAGHLLMILLSKVVLNFSFFSFIYMGLNLVEIFVGLIQSYIFVTMVCLYYSDLS